MYFSNLQQVYFTVVSRWPNDRYNKAVHGLENTTHNSKFTLAPIPSSILQHWCPCNYLLSKQSYKDLFVALKLIFSSDGVRVGVVSRVSNSAYDCCLGSS